MSAAEAAAAASPSVRNGKKVSDYDLMVALDGRWQGSVASPTTAAAAHVTANGNSHGYMSAVGSRTPARVTQAKCDAINSFCQLRLYKYILLDHARTVRISSKESKIQVLDPRGHRCDQRCEGLESTVESNLWICLQTGMLHYCGRTCELLQMCSPADGSPPIEMCPLSCTPFFQELSWQEDVSFSGQFALSKAENKSTAMQEALEVAQNLSVTAPLRSNTDIQRMAFARTMNAYYSRARGIMNRIFFSPQRRELDQSIVDSVYANLGKLFAVYIDSRSKVGRRPRRGDVEALFTQTIFDKTQNSGNMEHSVNLQPVEIEALLNRLACDAAALWSTFITYNCYSFDAGSKKQNDARHPVLDYQILALLYAMKEGIRDVKTGRVWLVRAPALKQMLPASSHLPRLGFDRAIFGKNESSFRLALERLQLILVSSSSKSLRTLNF